MFHTGQSLSIYVTSEPASTQTHFIQQGHTYSSKATPPNSATLWARLSNRSLWRPSTPIQTTTSHSLAPMAHSHHKMQKCFGVQDWVKTQRVKPTDSGKGTQRPDSQLRDKGTRDAQTYPALANRLCGPFNLSGVPLGVVHSTHPL